MKAKALRSAEVPHMETHNDVFDALYSDDPAKAAAMKLRSDAMINARASAPNAGHRRIKLSTRKPPSGD